jgi:FAD/FMN-containing dehydrogenase
MHPEHLELLPEGNSWLLVEFGGDSKEESDAEAQKLIDRLKEIEGAPSHHLLDDPPFEAAMWRLREEGLGATAHIPGEATNHDGWEDTAVHPQDVGEYLRDFVALIDKYGYRGSVYGHYGDGCIHVRLDFDLETAHGIQKYRRFVEEGADLVVKKYNGSLSGEHGDGQFRGELLERMFGPELIEAFVEFK